MGEKKYGDVELKNKNWIKETKEELYDAVNYLLYQINNLEKLENKIEKIKKRAKKYGKFNT